MKYAEIKAIEAMQTSLQRNSEGRAELFNLRFQMAASQLDSTTRVKAVKREQV